MGSGIDQTGEEPSVSVIVALRDEIELLESLLPKLKTLSCQARVVIADGMSSDGTYEVLAELLRNGETWFSLVRVPGSRGAAFNEGARIASADVLWFLHGDTRLPEGAIAHVRKAVADHPAGCFKVKFDGCGPFMRWNGFASNFRVRVGGIAFGDQGLFVRSNVFWELGGFPDIPLMEDYEFSRRLRARGVKLGLARSTLVASSRRYERGSRSSFATALHMLILRLRYRAGEPASSLIREYGDIR